MVNDVHKPLHYSIQTIIWPLDPSVDLQIHCFLGTWSKERELLELECFRELLSLSAVSAFNFQNTEVDTFRPYCTELE